MGNLTVGAPRNFEQLYALLGTKEMGVHLGHLRGIESANGVCCRLEVGASLAPCLFTRDRSCHRGWRGSSRKSVSPVSVSLRANR